MERFSLATVDTAAIKTEIEKSRAEKMEPVRNTPADKNMDAFIAELMGGDPVKQQDKPNPTTAAPVKSAQSKPSSPNKKAKTEGAVRHSICEELRTIKAEQKQKPPERRTKEKMRSNIPSISQNSKPRQNKNKLKKERT